MPSEHPPGRMWCHSQSSGPLYGTSRHQGEHSRDHHRSTPRLPVQGEWTVVHCTLYIHVGGVDCCTSSCTRTCSCICTPVHASRL